MNWNQSKAGHSLALRATDVARYAYQFYKISTCAETLRNFIKKKAPKEGRRGKETKDKGQSPSPKEAGHLGGNETTENQTFRQTHEAYQLKKERGSKPNKDPSLEKSSLAITTRLAIEAACVLYNATNILCL